MALKSWLVSEAPGGCSCRLFGPHPEVSGGVDLKILSRFFQKIEKVPSVAYLGVLVLIISTALALI